jgi:hypothetical protein
VAIGSALAWGLLGQSESVDALRYRGGLASVSGTVIASRATSMQQNDRPLWAIEARYEVGGVEHRVTSYDDASMEEGYHVTVEYQPGRPEVARIHGMRSRPFSAYLAVLLLFPVVGVGLALWQVRRGRHALALLCIGRVARGKLLEKIDTKVRVNEMPVYRMIFEFQDDKERTHRVEARTHRPERLEDDAHEQVLYDPTWPARATLVDSLPGSPRVDEAGRITGTDPLGLVGALAPPAVALLLNLFFLLR